MEGAREETIEKYKRIEETLRQAAALYKENPKKGWVEVGSTDPAEETRLRTQIAEVIDDDGLIKLVSPKGQDYPIKALDYVILLDDKE